MPASRKCPRRWHWPFRPGKSGPHSEIRAMLSAADHLHHQLEDTKQGLVAFMARAERVAELLEHEEDGLDEL